MALTIKGETYLTPDELAAGIGLKPSTLAKWRSDGVGPAYLSTSGGYSGGRILYPESAVHEYLKSLPLSETIK